MFPRKELKAMYDMIRGAEPFNFAEFMVSAGRVLAWVGEQWMFKSVSPQSMCVASAMEKQEAAERAKLASLGGPILPNRMAESTSGAVAGHPPVRPDLRLTPVQKHEAVELAFKMALNVKSPSDEKGIQAVPWNVIVQAILEILRRRRPLRAA